MSDQERIDLLDYLFDGYCKQCGADTGGRYCNCMNDE